MPPDSTPDAATLDEIRRFEAQYARSPESLVFARLADAYRKAGMLERALEVVEAGLVRHQGYLSAHIVRGRTLRELGRSEAATAAFHRVLDVDPQNLVALRALGEIARDRGRPEEARQWYERLAEVDPLDEQVRSTLESLDVTPGGPDGWEAPPGPEAGEGLPGEPDAWDDPRAEAETEAPEAEAPEAEAPSAEAPEAGAERAADEAPEVGEPGPAERPDVTPEAAERLDLATLTMAELYMRQGLYEEAERVYRQLLRFHPDDPALREKLETVGVLVRGSEEAGAGGAEARAGEQVEAETRAHPFTAATRSAAGRAGAPATASTIRRYLHALLEGTPSGSEEVPRPSAFDAWIEREARR